ncbi:hypothetical protein CYMTET_42292 [Cymbomonas tetramitiformis]|uniref:Uncharacterized protein n=1 Tax=Cymbomonas tetramitiformis TaxID=36881 RepID=A0AAE0C4E7_9CHLO|nr:hypothetical protein CYMTET_42292 [Cymbomonas tetramitiformis]
MLLPPDWERGMEVEGYVVGHLEDPVSATDLRTEFRESVIVEDAQRNLKELTPVQGSTKVKTKLDPKRFINDLQEGSAWEKSMERLGGDIIRLTQRSLRPGPPGLVVYPGSHLVENDEDLVKLESVTLHLTEKAVVFFDGRLVQGVEFKCGGLPRYSVHIYRWTRRA